MRLLPPAHTRHQPPEKQKQSVRSYLGRLKFRECSFNVPLCGPDTVLAVRDKTEKWLQDPVKKKKSAVCGSRGEEEEEEEPLTSVRAAAAAPALIQPSTERPTEDVSARQCSPVETARHFQNKSTAVRFVTNSAPAWLYFVQQREM